MARDEAGLASDVDILTDVGPDARFTLIDLVEIKIVLERRVRRPVDVVTPGSLDPRYRLRVMEEAATMF